TGWGTARSVLAQARWPPVLPPNGTEHEPHWAGPAGVRPGPGGPGVPASSYRFQRRDSLLLPTRRRRHLPVFRSASMRFRQERYFPDLYGPALGPTRQRVPREPDSSGLKRAKVQVLSCPLNVPLPPRKAARHRYSLLANTRGI